jgi:hypothetical protein
MKVEGIRGSASLKMRLLATLGVLVGDALGGAQNADAYTKVLLHQTTITSPAATVFNGKVCLAWTGTDGNHTLNVASSTNGLNLGTPNRVGPSNYSNAGPGLTAFN